MRKWAPQEVVLFLTLEAVPKLTLERLKSGTETNSPAYMYTIFNAKDIFLSAPKKPRAQGILSSRECLLERQRCMSERCVAQGVPFFDFWGPGAVVGINSKTNPR